MNIYTYYAQLQNFPEQQTLLDLWQRSWKMRGWDPVIQTVEDAKRHLLFNRVNDHVSQLPTINPKDYELACYYRWLALATVGGGWACDFDVINYTLQPHERKRDLELFTFGWFVPCLVWASPAGAEQILQYLIEYQANEDAHCSDMWCFTRLMQKGVSFGDTILCVELGDCGWRVADTVHFSNGTIERFYGHVLPKAEAVQQCGRTI